MSIFDQEYNKLGQNIINRVIKEICDYKNLDTNEIQTLITQRLEINQKRRICIGKTQKGQACRHQAKFAEDGTKDDKNCKYCSFHVPRGDPEVQEYTQCEGTNKTDRCRCTKPANHGSKYCTIHKYLESPPKDDELRIDNRNCIFYESNELTGELDDCKQLARPNRYTCSRCREREDDMIQQFKLPEFEKFKQSFDTYKQKYKDLLWHGFFT